MELSLGQTVAMKELVLNHHNVILCDSRIAAALQRRKLVKLVGFSHSRFQYVALTAKGRGVGEKLIG